MKVVKSGRRKYLLLGVSRGDALPSLLCPGEGEQERGEERSPPPLDMGERGVRPPSGEETDLEKKVSRPSLMSSLSASAG